MKTTRHGDCRRRFTRIFANEPAAQPKLLGGDPGALRDDRLLKSMAQSIFERGVAQKTIWNRSL
jgi:hypothetical protein